MATTLGKRKRRADLNASTAPETISSASPEPLQALFRKHFEAKYKPLPPLQIAKPPAATNDTDASDSEDSEWEGLDNGEEQAVTVVEHIARPKVEKDAVPKAELKTFMTPKPPLPSTTTRRPMKSKPTAAPSADPTESSLSTADLALHRLLTESHLLSSARSLSPSLSTPHTNPAPSSSLSNPSQSSTITLPPPFRHKAHDLRLLALGAKASLHVQQKMPMSHRKGMEDKRREREGERRREARENGVVLEREGKRGREARGKGKGKRERGVGVGDPSVGRWKGGMLVLGRRDVDAIEGRGERRGGRGGKRGRGR